MKRIDKEPIPLRERIERYLAACPPAVSGSHGHAAAFRVAESGEQCKAIEHNSRIGGEHHVRQTGNSRHDLQPCPGSGESCYERPEAALSSSQVTYRIFGPDAGLHPWVDPVAHLEVRGIGQ